MARIVSLCPSLTECLAALGVAGELVGITRYCTHPREALEGILRVGGTKDPDVAAIVALAPDLVLANAEENRAPDLSALASRVRVEVTHPRRVADVPGLLRRLGALTGSEKSAEEWAARVEAGRARAASRPRRSFSFATLVWKDPWIAAGDGTYVSDLIALFGGRNVFPSLPGASYPTVSLEELADAPPDRLFLPDEPFPFSESHRSFFRERLPATRVVLAPGEDLCWHGVRTLRGLEVMDELLSAD